MATEIQPQKKVTVNVSEQATDKPDSTPKEDIKKSYQKDTNQKETKSTKEVTQKKSNENTTKEDKKEEPIYDEYGYDQYGNYDPNKDLNNDREWNDEDYERWYDIYGDEEEDYDDYSEEPIQEADDVE